MGKFAALFMILVIVMLPLSSAKELSTPQKDQPPAEQNAYSEDNHEDAQELVLQEGGDQASEGTSTISSASFSTGIKDIGVALFKGDVTLNIPLASIPGRNGLGYEVQLTYNSDVDNTTHQPNNLSQAGVAGLGFSLSAGFIYRDFGSPITGGKDFLIDRSDDTFHISLPVIGNTELIAVLESDVVLEDGFRVSQYRTKAESYSKIEQYTSPNGRYVSKWVITDSSGTKYTFDHRRETIVYNFNNQLLNQMNYRKPLMGCSTPSGCNQQVFNTQMLAGSDRMNYQWDITLIEDVNGNKIHFEYQDEVRTIECTRSYDLEINTACFQPYTNPQQGYAGLREKYDCVKQWASTFCDSNTGVCSGSSPAFEQMYASCNSEVGGSAASNSYCEQSLGGLCKPYGSVCDNATTIQDFVAGTDGLGGVYGVFICPVGQMCWRSTDVNNQNSQQLSCRSSQQSVSDDCSAFGGHDIFGYASNVDNSDTCAGYYVGQLNLAGQQAQAPPTQSSSRGEILVMSSFDNHVQLAQEHYINALREGYSVEQARWLYSFSYNLYEQYYWYLRDQSVRMGDRINTPSQLSLLPPMFSEGAQNYIEGDTHCCASLNPEQKGQWKPAMSASTCSVMGLTGAQTPQEGISQLRERYAFGGNEAFGVGCYNRYTLNPSQQQYCVGYDVGPSRCNAHGQELMKSCCVGSVVTTSTTRPQGQCVMGLPSPQGGVTRSCSVNSQEASCTETYVATSHLKKITDSAGYTIEFEYANDRQDFDTIEPTTIELDICEGEDSPGRQKTIIFQESEHVTTNHELRLVSVVTKAPNNDPLSKVVLETSYRTHPDMQEQEGYEKLMLDALHFSASQPNIHTSPPVEFTYNDQLLLQELNYPTGGSLSFEYEPVRRSEDYSMVRFRPFVQSQDDFPSPLWGPEWMTCEEAENYGFVCPDIAGYRVIAKTIHDGVGNSYTTAFSYDDARLHMERSGNFIGHSSVTTILPANYGYVQSWYYNDVNSIDIINEINADCRAVPEVASDYNVIVDNKFFELTDAEYKTELRTSPVAGQGVVSWSKSLVCPQKVFVQPGGRSTFQTNVYKQSSFIDGILSESLIRNYHPVNGLPQDTYSFGSQGEVLRETVVYKIDDQDVVAEQLLERNILSAVKQQSVYDDTTNTLLSSSKNEFEFFGANTYPQPGCESCALHIHKISSWLEDSNNNGLYDEGDLESTTQYLSYDRFGHALLRIDPLGSQSRSYYGHDGQCAHVEDESFNPYKVSCEQNALGFQTKFYYTSAGILDRVVNTNGIETLFEYDSAYRVVQKKLRSEGKTVVMEEYDYHYGLDGGCEQGLFEGNDLCMNWVRTTNYIDHDNDVIGESVAYTDGLARHMRTKSVAPTGVVSVDTLYNEVGKVHVRTQPVVESTKSLVYGDARSIKSQGQDYMRILYSQDPLIRPYKAFPLGTEDHWVETKHGSDGEFWKHTIIDENRRNLTSTIDKLGNVIMVTGPQGVVSRTEYDLLGRPTEHYDRLGRIASNSTYDKAGRIRSEWDLNIGTTTYLLNNVGNVLQMTDSMGRTFVYVYDALHRVTQISLGSTPLRTHYYDSYQDATSCSLSGLSNGYLCEVVDHVHNTRLRYVFDSWGRTKSVTETILGESYTTSYTYTDAGFLVGTLMANGNSIEYSYNELGELSTARINGGEPIIVDYTDEGLIRTLTYPTTQPVVQTFEYHPRKWISSINVQDVFSESYEYDPTGTLLGINGDVEYVYDDWYRLAQIRNDGYYPVSGLSTIQYFYDAVGNRLGRVTDADEVVGTNNYAYYEGTERLASSTNGKNLVPNPSFEASSGVHAGGWSSTTSAQLEVVGAPVKYGHSAARVTKTAPQPAWSGIHSSPIFLESGTYSLSGWIRMQDSSCPSCTPSIGAHLRLKCWDSADESSNNVVLDRASGRVDGSEEDYSYVSVNTVSIPQNTHHCVVILNFDPGTNTGASAFFDGVQLERGSTSSFEDACTYSYDALGSVLSKTCADSVTTYSYDVFNQLVSIQEPLVTYSFEYDSLGRRVVKRESSAAQTTTTWYVYGQGSRPLITYTSITEQAPRSLPRSAPSTMRGGRS